MAVRQDASTGQMVDDGQKTTTSQAPGGKSTIHVKVYSPFKVYFEEEALSVTGQNATGAFDILPHHHNFITLLQAGELTLRTPNGESRIKIASGLMHVKADQVTVFLDV